MEGTPLDPDFCTLNIEMQKFAFFKKSSEKTTGQTPRNNEVGIEDFGLTQQGIQTPVDQKLDRTIHRVKICINLNNPVVSATEMGCMKKGPEKLLIKWQILSQSNNLYTRRN